MAHRTGRVRRRCCHRLLPSEPDMRLSPHPAQASRTALSSRTQQSSVRILPHSGTLWVAFTIRTSGAPWARRTLRTILPHLWACQWRTSLESASAHGRKLASVTTVNVLLSFDAYTSPLVRRHQHPEGTRVCSLSSGVMLRALNPYPSHYKTRVPIGRAYSIFLYLLPYGLALRFGFPCRRAAGSGTPWVSFRVDTRVL